MVEKSKINLHHAKYKNLEQLIRDVLQLGILDAVGDGVSIQDTEFKIVFQNQVHINIVGDHLGKYCYEAYRRRQQVCEGCPIAESFLDGGVHTVSRRATINNKALYFDITASPIRDSEGKIVAGIEIVRNITEHRQAEETLVESEKKYRGLVESSPDMIFTTDRETGKIIDVNESVCRLLGYGREEIIGTVSGGRVVPIQRNDYNSEFNKLRETGSYSGEYEIIKKDGSTIFVEVRGVAFDHYLFAIGRDITQRKKFEEEVKDRVKELESFYEMAIGRETKMMKLKREIEKLREELATYKKIQETD